MPKQIFFWVFFLFIIHAKLNLAFGQSAEDQFLEQQLQTEKEGSSSKSDLKGISLYETLVQINAIEAQGERASESQCIEAHKVFFSKKYVITYDGSDKPCRIYDLSFPTLKTLFFAQQLIPIPIQNFSSGDFLNWMEGNTEAIRKKIENFKTGFDPRKALQNSWVSLLKFRRPLKMVEGSEVGDKGLPESFSAADLDLGKSLEFDAATRAEIEKLITQQNERKENGEEPLVNDYWLQVLEKPEKILEDLRFEWNPTEKMYNLTFVPGFLPLFRPVALVDFQLPHQYAVDQMVRAALSSALQQLTNLIIIPVVGGAVRVAVQETFDLIDISYNYQMAQLDEALNQTIKAGTSESGLIADLQKGSYLLAGARTNLLAAYLMAKLKKQSFDSLEIQKIGKKARYDIEKKREVSMSVTNNQLVQKKKCDVELFQDYFSICSHHGQREKIYSLISELTFFGKSFGPPTVYSFSHSHSVLLKRSLAWMLSMGLRIVRLPVVNFVLGRLDGMLRDYRMAGLYDEAILRHRLTSQEVGADVQSLVQNLYLQNLNPLLPKSQSAESAIITTHLKQFETLPNKGANND